MPCRAQPETPGSQFFHPSRRDEGMSSATMTITAEKLERMALGDQRV
jgi:hypothetical protein